MDTLNHMRAFVAVARQQSFTGGAGQLNRSTKLVSKQVAQLERTLGVQLLHRTTRKVSLTDIGKTYLHHCIPLLDHFDEVENLIQECHSELAGSIRITAPTGFGSAQLVQALHPFQQQHPKVQIDLVLSDRWIDLLEQGLDMAIRFGHLPDSTLLGRKLAEMRIVTFASPDYLAATEALRRPNDLLEHNCLLRQSSAASRRWLYRLPEGEIQVPVSGNFRASSPRAVAHAAASGLGVGRGPIYAVRPFLDRGELQIVLAEYETAPVPLNAIYPPGRHLLSRVRALTDHLVEAFSSGFG